MVDQPSAWIISVGNELLIGRIINTNASYLARRLTFLGFKVTRIITVPDEVSDISEEIKRGLERASLIITTGGLGPTYDDLTLEGIAQAIGVSLELNEEAYRQVREFYERKGLPLTRERLKMAMLPRGAVPLRNTVGAAPGVFLEVNGRIIVALPGVPKEMEAIFEDEVVPRIKVLAPEMAMAECSIVVKGVPESSLAPVLSELARRNPRAYIKSHPKGHEVEMPILDIRVLASMPNSKDALEYALKIIEEIKQLAEELGGVVEEKHCGGSD